jgi:hypothetical protein
MTSTAWVMGGGLVTAEGRNIGPGIGVASPLPGSRGRVAGDETVGTDEPDAVVCRDAGFEDEDEVVEGTDIEVEVDAAGLGCGGVDSRLRRT